MADDHLILIVEDEELLRALLAKTLRQAGYCVLCADNGADALALLQRHDIDLILLDILLPKMDGLTLCKRVRAISAVPILVLSAMGSAEDIVHGLELGADDYIAKPFRFSEVLVRIHSILRRVAWSERREMASVLSQGAITLDRRANVVHMHGNRIRLTPTEYKLLRYLMLHSGRPIDNETLLQEVWGYTGEENASIIQSVVRRLRLKLESDPSEPQHIVSVWGVGYKFQTPTLVCH